jgi:hypothetical protein
MVDLLLGASRNPRRSSAVSLPDPRGEHHETKVSLVAALRLPGTVAIAIDTKVSCAFV